MNARAIARFRPFGFRRPQPGPAAPALLGIAGSACLLLLGGCNAPALLPPGSPPPASAAAQAAAEPFTLQGGDVIRVAFPSTPSLDASQPIRNDGKITLPMIGEVQAAGKTPVALEKELITLYTPHLVSKEVTVAVVSSSFSVFVTGAVLKPGKVVTDRQVSVLEAIMEAGGFDNAKADMSAVVVVRQVDGTTQNYTLNLKNVLTGRRQAETFLLRRSDIIYVPEKFTWF